MKKIKGYHFTGDTLRGGGLIPKIGEWLEHKGEVIACSSGLHASEHSFNALQYAPGKWLHKVELEDDLVSHGEPADKWCGRRRKILATIDSEALMREFARWCALQVVHLWKAPDVVVQYLKTGDESIRAAAWAAERAAAWVAAEDAAWAAARAAAWAAAEDAAEDAAWAAAEDAAEAAAWAAAEDAAWAAAWAAAEGAAWAAAWAAARDAAWDAARAAAWVAQRNKFQELVDAAFDEQKGGS
jgi:hypothetical protein